MIALGFVGAGNMGTAIMRGFSKSSFSAGTTMYAYDCDTDKLEKLADIGVKACASEREVFEKCKYVVLAVKPQQLGEVIGEVKDAVNSETVIISICAGISDEYLAERTIDGVKAVLVMPNTPLLLGEGATALSKSDSVSEEEFEYVCSVFSSCGECAVIPKDKMNEIIAINGSAPAFIYLYAKSFIDYAKSVGIDVDSAKKLFSKTLIGSGKMITESGCTIEELIKMVSSKGGTTIAGLEKLGDGRMQSAVQDCCEACTKRAYELAE